MYVINGRSRAGYLLVLALLLPGLVTLAQPNIYQGNPGIQEKVAALKESLLKNQAALKAYSWTETTEISLNGEVKKLQQKECHYGPDGKVQKTLISDQSQPAPGRERLLREEIVKHKVDALKDYMEQAVAVVHQYVPPDPQKIQAAAAAGNVSLQPASAPGITTLTITDYLKAGDKLFLGFDPNAKKLRSYQVQSYVEQPNDALTLAVTFASLPDGTNYPQQSILNVVTKQVQVKITNSGYAKTAQ